MCSCIFDQSAANQLFQTEGNMVFNFLCNISNKTAVPRTVGPAAPVYFNNQSFDFTSLMKFYKCRQKGTGGEKKQNKTAFLQNMKPFSFI